MSDNLDLVLEYLGGQRYDDYAACLCKFHDDTRPSLMVREDTYKCLACGAFGKTKDLVASLSGMPLKAAPISDFRNPFTRWMKDKSLGDVLKGAYRTNKANPSVYLRDKRKIPVETQLAYKLGQRDDWITIPVMDEGGKIVGAVARANETNTTKSKYVVPNGQDGNLLYIPDWSLHLRARFTFLVFGVLDAVTLSMLGYPAISTLSGKRLDPIALDGWRKQIIFIPDEGEEADAGKISAALGWRAWVWRVNWPDGCKDIQDIYVKDSNYLREELRKKTVVYNGNVLG